MCLGLQPTGSLLKAKRPHDGRSAGLDSLGTFSNHNDVTRVPPSKETDSGNEPHRGNGRGIPLDESLFAVCKMKQFPFKSKP